MLGTVFFAHLPIQRNRGENIKETAIARRAAMATAISELFLIKSSEVASHPPTRPAKIYGMGFPPTSIKYANVFRAAFVPAWFVRLSPLPIRNLQQ